jgi:hypothetical protein
LATNHNAACYFSVLERDAGFIKGGEEWVHIDKREHPDNAYLGNGIMLSPAITFQKLCAYLDNNNTGSNCGISDANFMTAQAKIFPGMRFIHLHDSRDPDLSATTWGGMKFDRACPVEECDRVLLRHLPRILSLDLDVFGNYPDLEDRKTHAMKDNVLEIARASNIVMIFTTPDLVETSRVEQLMSDIVRDLIDDKY